MMSMECERFDTIVKNTQHAPIVVFPEGTNSNGEGLLQYIDVVDACEIPRNRLHALAFSYVQLLHQSIGHATNAVDRPTCFAGTRTRSSLRVSRLVRGIGTSSVSAARYGSSMPHVIGLVFGAVVVVVVVVEVVTNSHTAWFAVREPHEGQVRSAARDCQEPRCSFCSSAAVG